jgi:hypothetical protein
MHLVAMSDGSKTKWNQGKFTGVPHPKGTLWTVLWWVWIALARLSLQHAFGGALAATKNIHTRYSVGIGKG